MKKFSFIAMMAAAVMMIASCQEKEPKGDAAGLTLSDVSVSESVAVPGILQVSAKVADANVDLSTLEISVALEEGKVIAGKSVRTSGKSADVYEEIDVPFTAGMTDQSEIVVTLEAINVDGASVKKVVKVNIVRPQLPETLYMIIGEEVYEMAYDATTKLYATEEGEFDSILTATIATAEDPADADFIWGTSTEDNIAEICALSDVTGISISYPKILVTAYTFDPVSFVVEALGEVLEVSVNGVALEPQSGLLYGSIAFTKDAAVTITGLDDLVNAYNRDFFGVTSDGYKFLRDSGTYDVYYSPKYNYFWVMKMEAVAPECFWIVGHGFTEAPVWHEDFGYGGWEMEPVTAIGYAPKIADNLYQVSLYLSNAHEWDTFEFEVYSDLDWGKDKGFGGKSITGFNKGVKLSNAADGLYGLTSDTGFQPGYYTITFNNATGEINLDRHTEWVDASGSGIVIAGTELLEDTVAGYDYATVSFTNGAEVSFSGIQAEALNRDFFKIENNKAYFRGVTGEYLVQYFPKNNYIWLTRDGMALPDCIYILGTGKFAAPVFDNAASWDIDGWTRTAPNLVVAPKIADNTYQATMSMSTDTSGWRVLLEFYSDLEWGQEGVTPVAITGTAASRFKIEETYILGVDEQSDPFVPGNYRLVMTPTTNGISIDITKVD